MSYMSVGAADTEWCSGSNPQGGCSGKKTCVPLKPATFEAFKLFQTQLNRFGANLVVDGQIGAKAVAALSKVPGFPAVPNCEFIARNVEMLTQNLTVKANGTPSLPPPAPIPPSKPVRQAGGGIKEGNPGNKGGQTEESILDTITSFVTSPMGMVVAAGAIGAVIYLTRKKKPAAVAAAQNPSSKRGLWVWDWIGGGGNNHYGTRSEAVREAKSLGRPRTYMGRKSIELKVKPGSMRLTSKSYDDRFYGWGL